MSEVFIDKNGLKSTNPARGYALIGQIEISSPDEILKKVERARIAQKDWYAMGLDERVGYMRDLHIHFKQHKEELMRKQSVEMGMPIGLSQVILDDFLSEMLWDCDHAKSYLEPEILYEDDHEVTELRHEPYGVVACIVAWNFPFGNFVVSLVQALLAGNTVVMKYSEEVPLFSRYIETLIASSNLPVGVINFVYGGGDVGSFLADQAIDCLSFTGSSSTGQKLYEKAASRLLPVALEMGGSCPAIIFQDHPIGEDFIEHLFWKRFLNSGQFCNGMKRLIVHHSLLDEVVTKLYDCARNQKIGDPLDDKTSLGPLVSEQQVIRLEAQVTDALDKGAKLHGGGRPQGLKGAFYMPTILTQVQKDMRIWKEEVFGPVLPVVGFDTYKEAISLANDTEYGLSGSVFTLDRDLARRAQMDIHAGLLDHNTAHNRRPQNPFGGYKRSGIGYQKGRAGFESVTQIKVMALEK